MAKPKTIILIVPFMGGHHLELVQLYTASLLGEGHLVIVVCQKHEQIREYINRQQPENIKNLESFHFLRGF